MCLSIKRDEKLKILLAAFLCFLLVACSEKDNSRTIKRLNVAVVPHQNKSILRNHYQPLIEHLKEHIGIPAKLLIPDSYEQLLSWFVDKKVDIALLGGVGYVKAHQKVNAVPLVMRDVDSRFKSIVLVRSSSPAENLKDLQQVSFSFGSLLSTSGHFMPRYFFQRKNIIAENFFSKVLYSGAHDRTAEWVRDGTVAAGVVNAGIANEMFLDGRLSKNKVKVIWESPTFADYVWAIQPDINKEQKIKIRDAFLHMNQDSEDIKMLKKLGANYYIPASHEDYRNLEKIILLMEQKKTKE